MSYHNELWGYVRDTWKTQRRLADFLGISEQSVSHKMYGIRPWKNEEVVAIVEAANIPRERVWFIFFEH